MKSSEKIRGIFEMNFQEVIIEEAPRALEFPFGAFLVSPFPNPKYLSLRLRRCTMFYRRIWIAVIVVILGLAMFVPVAQAQRQDFETRQCSTQTFNIVHYSPEVGVLSVDQKSIIQSTHASKLFDNWTLHLVGVHKMMSGKWSWNGVSKEMGPDGEFIIWEYYGDTESGTMAKPIYGTGKWKGVKGERKSKVITAGKPIVQGTAQFCQQQVGWIELPK